MKNTLNIKKKRKQLTIVDMLLIVLGFTLFIGIPYFLLNPNSIYLDLLEIFWPIVVGFIFLIYSVLDPKHRHNQILNTVESSTNFVMKSHNGH